MFAPVADEYTTPLGALHEMVSATAGATRAQDQRLSEARMNDPLGLYARLAAPFDVTFSDVRGGVPLTYITGEQVTSRLNEVLTVAGWSFRVLRHEIHAEADEAWCLGELTAEIDGKTIVKQQFGSQKLKRSRSSGTPLDIGFDLKGAATDSMKKCASLLGVGLYLSHKEPPRPVARQAPSRFVPQQRPA